MCDAVTDTSGNAAACSNERFSGIGSTLRNGTFTYSA